MLTDSDNTDYEPYVGGIPSPNPEYPQEITSITGDVKITGKNLVDENSSFFNLWYGSGSTKFYNNSNFTSCVIEVQPNTTYTVSKKNSSNRFVVMTSTSQIVEGAHISRILLQENNSTRKQYTFTTNESEKYLFFGFYSGTNEDEIRLAQEEIQIEEGSIATSYKPYKQVTIPLGITELCKIGNVADKLVIDTKTGEVIKSSNISKYTFTGDERIVLLSSNSNGNLFEIREPIFPLDDYTTDYLNNYSIANTSSYTPNGQVGSYVFNGTYRIRVPNSIATTAEEFVTWLATANNTIYYPLATTTTETITTLTAEQLEILKPDDEENNYQIITNLGNMNIQIKYARDINKVIAILEQ